MLKFSPSKLKNNNVDDILLIFLSLSDIIKYYCCYQY